MDKPKTEGSLAIAISDNLIWILLGAPADRFSMSVKQGREVARAILECADKLEGGGGLIIPRGRF